MEQYKDLLMFSHATPGYPTGHNLTRPLARLLKFALAWMILIGLSVIGALWHFNRPWF